MSKVMLALGGYRFSIDTAAHETLRRTDAYRWIRQPRHGRAPAKQYLGPDAAEIELRGTIHPHYKGGLGQIDAMRAEAGKGEPLILVDGLGGVHGKWVIERIEEERSLPIDDGRPRKVTFTVRISQYGEDG